MVMDALRGYVQLANGLTEVTKQKAQAAAKALLQQTGADTLTTRVTDLADEIVATSKSNRQLLQAIVANEVEGAVARLGFVRSEEVAALTRRVKTLETELAEARATGAAPATSAAADNLSAQAAAASAKKTARKAPARSAAKKATVEKSAAKRAPANKTTAKNTTAKKTAKKA